MFSWSNAELTSLTQGVYTARELAINRMEAEAHAVHAEGVVGVTVEMKVNEYEDGDNNRWYIMTFNAFGTAIAGDSYHSEVKTPGLTVTLLDRSTINLYHEQPLSTRIHPGPSRRRRSTPSRYAR